MQPYQKYVANPITHLIMFRFSIGKKFWNVYDFYYFLDSFRLSKNHKNCKNSKIMFLPITLLIILQCPICKKFWNVYNFYYFLASFRLSKDHKNCKNSNWEKLWTSN